MGKSLEIVTTLNELGAGTRGSSLGFEALKFASLKSDPLFFSKRKVTAVPTQNHLLFEHQELPLSKKMEGIAQMYHNIESHLSKALTTQSPVTVISGDHANAGGTIAGIKKAFPDQRLGVIWIDAHGDLHSPFTTPSGNIHGMPLGTALASDNLENQNTEPGEKTVKYWNEMKGEEQRVRFEDLFFVGLRDTEQPEDALRKKHDIPNIKVAELRKKGAKAIAVQALEYLADCDILYISFDVDSMDTSVSVGTGTPVDGGLLEDEARELLLALAEDDRIRCFETTEINPLLDKNGNSMGEAAFRIVKPMIEKLESKL